MSSTEKCHQHNDVTNITVTETDAELPGVEFPDNAYCDIPLR